MPNSYNDPAVKKYLDANGLAYFSQRLNNYPTNDVIAAVVEGVQDALDEKIDVSSKGAANGVASLGNDGKVPSSQLPAIANTTYTLTQNISDGHTITFTGSDGTSTPITIPDNNTEYEFDGTYNAVSNKAATVQTVVDAVSRAGTITEIVMNGSSLGTSGSINLGTVITDISSKQNVIQYNTTAGWRSNLSFIPSNGEIIIYTDKETFEEGGQTVTVPGIKIGDGSAYGIDLPFLGEKETARIMNMLNSHLNNTNIHITAAERSFWNSKLNCALSGEILEINRN